MNDSHSFEQGSSQPSQQGLAGEIPAHLTDDQFAELLAGTSPDVRVEFHLRRCEPCREELAAVLGFVAEFNTTSLEWAKREAPRRVPMPSRWAVRLGWRPAWSAGLVAAAAAAVFAIGMYVPQHAADARLSAVSSTGGALRRGDASDAPTRADLATDNRLLASIDQELNAVPQPAIPVAVLKDSPSHAAVQGWEAVEN